MPLAWFDLGGDAGGYAGYVGVDTHGVVRTGLGERKIESPILKKSSFRRRPPCQAVLDAVERSTKSRECIGPEYGGL